MLTQWLSCPHPHGSRRFAAAVLLVLPVRRETIDVKEEQLKIFE